MPRLNLTSFDAFDDHRTKHSWKFQSWNCTTNRGHCPLTFSFFLFTFSPRFSVSFIAGTEGICVSFRSFDRR